MADLYAIAGSKFFIGGVLETKATDFVAADFTSQTWVEVDGWETMGTLGDSRSVITMPLINRPRDIKIGGTANAGTYEANFAILDGNAGQTALKAARATGNNYAFKVEYFGGDVEQFIGIVTAATRQGGSANTVQMLSVTIEVNSNVVES